MLFWIWGCFVFSVFCVDVGVNGYVVDFVFGMMWVVVYCLALCVLLIDLVLRGCTCVCYCYGYCCFALFGCAVLTLLVLTLVGWFA